MPWLVAVPPRDTLLPPIDPLDEEEWEEPLTIGDDEPLDEEGLLLPTLLLLPPKESPLPPLGCPL